MSGSGRHRAVQRHTNPVDDVGDHKDRVGALAFVLLALVGAAAPLWELRGQVSDLFGTGSPASVSLPDIGSGSGG